MGNMDFENKEGYIRGHRRKGGIIIDDYLNEKPFKTIANRMKELKNLSEEEWKELYDTKSNKIKN